MPTHPPKPSAAGKVTLAGVKPGETVRIMDLENLPDSYQRHLQAYGLLPGRSVRVLSNQPLIILQIEQTELAIEISVAQQVFVEALDLPV